MQGDELLSEPLFKGSSTYDILAHEMSQFPSTIPFLK